jgi:hypothetical protein
VPQNAKSVGEWIEIEIEVFKGSIWHSQNGETVLEYHLGTDKWNEIEANSKFPELNPDWTNVAKSCVIALPDRGDDAWYRNIIIPEK